MKGTKVLEPDEITFLNVLSACWHGRVPLDVVRVYFDEMRIEYRIDPMPEHCCLMMKVMGQEGDVRDAEKMINELGFEACGMVWRALLGACVSCGDVRAAEVAARRVVELEGENEFVYTSLSNVYACRGNWDGAARVRRVMKERKVRKEAGCSWIELDK